MLMQQRKFRIYTKKTINMSDSEDDFMSDKFLMSSVKQDIRPGLLFNQSQKRQHDILKKQLEVQQKRQKPYHVQEKAARDKGLNTAISSDNKGFKMLEKMGFKAGSSLGKQNQGLKVPINISLKCNTSGVGLENRVKEIFNKKNKQKETQLQEIEVKFKAAYYEKQQLSSLRRDYFKSQRICEELDFRNNVTTPLNDFFWTMETLAKMIKTEELDEESDEEPELVTDEKLLSIIEYLRDKYNYCMYCAITGSDKEDLERNCPGALRIDHDDFN